MPILWEFPEEKKERRRILAAVIRVSSSSLLLSLISPKEKRLKKPVFMGAERIGKRERRGQQGWGVEGRVGRDWEKEWWGKRRTLGKKPQGPDLYHYFVLSEKFIFCKWDKIFSQ